MVIFVSPFSLKKKENQQSANLIFILRRRTFTKQFTTNALRLEAWETPQFIRGVTKGWVSFQIWSCAANTSNRFGCASGILAGIRPFCKPLKCSLWLDVYAGLVDQRQFDIGLTWWAPSIHQYQIINSDAAAVILCATCFKGNLKIARNHPRLEMISNHYPL